jgi:hypothetical protein
MTSDGLSLDSAFWVIVQKIELGLGSPNHPHAGRRPFYTTEISKGNNCDKKAIAKQKATKMLWMGPSVGDCEAANCLRCKLIRTREDCLRIHCRCIGVRSVKAHGIFNVYVAHVQNSYVSQLSRYMHSSN